MAQKEKEDNKKKKKVRKALLLLLGKLNKKCGSFKKLDEWLSFLKHNLDPIVNEYQEQIPHDVLMNFQKAKKYTDSTQEAINKACDNLKWNIEKVIKLLPAHSPLVKLLVIGTALTGGLVAAAVLIVNLKTVTITVKNSGCDTIYPMVYMPVQVPGLKLFESPIPNGGQGTISIFPLPVTVDATNKGTISVSLFGITLPYNLRGNDSGASDISFNGNSLIGKKTDINLSERATHELVISCR